MNKKIVVICLVAFVLLTLGSTLFYGERIGVDKIIALSTLPKLGVEPQPPGDGCYCGATLCGTCSTYNPGYYCPVTGGGLVANCQQCGCSGVDDICQTDGTCVPNVGGNIDVGGDNVFSPGGSHDDCEDGTEHGECSENEENAGLYCNDGEFEVDCTLCGSYCWDGIGACTDEPFWDPIGCTNEGARPLKCYDGTLFDECSLSMPFYCNEGTLTADCVMCGCPEGNFCDIETKTCELGCYDGTPYFECSLFRPYFCGNGTLIEDCSSCGCDEGLLCDEDSDECYEPSEEESIIDFERRAGLNENDAAIVRGLVGEIVTKKDIPERDMGKRKPFIEYNSVKREIKITILNTEMFLFRDAETKEPVINLNF